jgi:RNA polymerase sigma-70 factor (ECF subfamily)
MSLATSPTLLERVRDAGDAGAWYRFYSFYAPLIVGFCLNRGCPRPTADDVLQETMVALLRQMPTFRYDPSRGKFRSYVLKIAHRRMLRTLARDQREGVPASESQHARLVAKADSAAEAPWAEWDAAFDRRLLEAGLERVRARVSEQTFESFRLYVIEGHSVPTVMARTGVAEANTVHQHKNRVLRYLGDELRTLRRELGE